MTVDNPKPTSQDALSDKHLNGFQWDAEAARVFIVDESGAVVNSLSQYITHDIVESGTSTYFCKEKLDGTWLIALLDESSGYAKTFANISNNSSYLTYAAALAAVASLNYVLIENLTGL